MGAVGNAVKGAVGDYYNYATFGISGALGDDGGPQNQEGWDQAEDLRQLDKSRDELVNQSNDYRIRLPEEQERQFQGANDVARRQLATQMKGIDQGANRRGLLYSGLNQGAQSNANQAYASGLMNQRAQINQNTEAQAKAMDNRAIQAGLQQQNARAQAAAAKYQTDQAQKQRTGGLLGNAVGGAGSFIGGFSGGR